MTPHTWQHECSLNKDRSRLTVKVYCTKCETYTEITGDLVVERKELDRLIDFGYHSTKRQAHPDCLVQSQFNIIKGIQET